MTLYEETNLIAWYRSEDQQLRSAFDSSHYRMSVSAADRRLLLPSRARRLLSVNAKSRNAIARALCAKLEQRLCVNEFWEHERNCFFLTIIPKDGIVRADLRGFSLKPIADRLRVVLRGLNYLAAIEPGYYASLPLQDRTIGTQVISWHVHALVWNVTIGVAGNLIERLRKMDAHRSVVPELPAVHIRQVNNGELPKAVRYLLKPSAKAKRVQRYPWIKDGEIVRYADGRARQFLKQLSSVLQKSERLRLFHATKHLTLDQLLVGGGEGKTIRADALKACNSQGGRQIAV